MIHLVGDEVTEVECCQNNRFGRWKGNLRRMGAQSAAAAARKTDIHHHHRGGIAAVDVAAAARREIAF